ncbi:MAG: hypothetical protein ACT4O1_12555 [Gemmatimonadota bacterium]
MSNLHPIDAAIGRLKRIYTPDAGRPSEDPEPDLADTTENEADDLAVELSWPPPGLEHIHGLLTRITVEFWFAALIMIATVAIAALRERPAEAGSWGTVAVLLVVGLLLWGAYMRLLVVFNRATSAVRAGYPRQIVWHVAADWARDTPQILRGEQSFERLPVAARARLLDARVAASWSGLAGAVWITATLPVWLMFGARGAIEAPVVWLATLLPAALCVSASIFFRVREIRALYGNRIPDEEDRHAAQQARGWRHLYGRVGYQNAALDMGSRYRVAGTAAVFAIFAILIPLAMAAFTMVFPFILGDNAAMYSTMVRVVALTPLREYHVPLDTGVTRTAAGTDLRAAAVADAARARRQAQTGEPDSAETTARRIISVGFVTADDAWRFTDAMSGTAVVQLGADALADVYRASGRTDDEARIRAVLATTAAASQSALSLARGSRTTRRGLERIVLRNDVPRAIRWHAYASVSTLARCGSLTGMVFGVGERHRAFERAAHAALVRSPDEQNYFARVSGGDRCNFGLMRRAFRGG